MTSLPGRGWKTRGEWETKWRPIGKPSPASRSSVASLPYALLSSVKKAYYMYLFTWHICVMMHMWSGSSPPTSWVWGTELRRAGLMARPSVAGSDYLSISSHFYVSQEILPTKGNDLNLKYVEFILLYWFTHTATYRTLYMFGDSVYQTMKWV